MSGQLERAIVPRLEALERFQQGTRAKRTLRQEEVMGRLADLEAKVSRLMDGLPAAGQPDVLYLGPDVSEEVHEILIEAGFDTNEKVRQASDAELRAVHGVGPATLKRIRVATSE